MPRKKDGMLFEIHPTPAKGKDGKNILYVRPLSGQKLSMKGVEDFCSRNYGLRYGELSRAFDVFLRAAGELMEMAAEERHSRLFPFVPLSPELEHRRVQS
jgi:hypothetical protein